MKLNAHAREFLCSQIEKYLQNFGKFNKTDFEILIFKSLLIGQKEPLSNYSLSRELKIKEAKVKSLRYDADLMYNHGEDYENEKFHEFINVLGKTKFKIENANNFKYRLEFVIEDPALRKFIDNKMKEAGTYTDTSFNTEIIRISPKDLAIVLESFPEGKKLAKKVMTEVNILLRQKNLEFQSDKHLSFSDVFPALLLHLFETASNVSGFALSFTPAKLVGSVTSSLINKIITKNNQKQIQ